MKIALLGTAPSSVGLAPYDDKSWTIWTCSADNMDVPRSDLHFELHSIDRLRKHDGYRPYLKWLVSRPCYMNDKRVEYPKSMAYPFREILQKYEPYGKYFCTSSLAWMLALAIDAKPDAIGLWGIDMDASDEYSYQRPGCHYFIGKAIESGIDLVVPPESDILEPPPPYGFCENTRMWRKLYARKREFEQERANAKLRRLNATTDEERMQAIIDEASYGGGLQEIEYTLHTWSNKG